MRLASRVPAETQWVVWSYPAMENLSYADAAHPDVAFVLGGGFLYFDGHWRLLAANSLVQRSSGPLRMMPPTAHSVAPQRFKHVKLPALLEAGVTHYCWILPSEAPPCGAFTYRMRGRQEAISFFFQEPLQARSAYGSEILTERSQSPKHKFGCSQEYPGETHTGLMKQRSLPLLEQGQSTGPMKPLRNHVLQGMNSASALHPGPSRDRMIPMLKLDRSQVQARGESDRSHRHRTINVGHDRDIRRGAEAGSPQYPDGSCVEYQSSANGGCWVPARVLSYNSDSGFYVLDVQPQASPNKIREAWSMEHVISLASPDEACCGRVPILDKARFNSVQNAIDDLRKGKIVARDGFCAVFSNTRGSYCLVFQPSKRGQAFRACGLEDGRTIVPRVQLQEAGHVKTVINRRIAALGEPSPGVPYPSAAQSKATTLQTPELPPPVQVAPPAVPPGIFFGTVKAAANVMLGEDPVDESDEGPSEPVPPPAQRSQRPRATLKVPSEKKMVRLTDDTEEPPLPPPNFFGTVKQSADVMFGDIFPDSDSDEQPVPYLPPQVSVVGPKSGRRARISDEPPVEVQTLASEKSEESVRTIPRDIFFGTVRATADVLFQDPFTNAPSDDEAADELPTERQIPSTRSNAQRPPVVIQVGSYLPSRPREHIDMLNRTFQRNVGGMAKDPADGDAFASSRSEPQPEPEALRRELPSPALQRSLGSSRGPSVTRLAARSVSPGSGISSSRRALSTGPSAQVRTNSFQGVRHSDPLSSPSQARSPVVVRAAPPVNSKVASRPEYTPDRPASQVSVTPHTPHSRTPERNGVKVVEVKPGLPHGVFFGAVRETADVMYEANYFHRI